MAVCLGLLDQVGIRQMWLSTGLRVKADFDNQKIRENGEIRKKQGKSTKFVHNCMSKQNSN